MAGPLKAMHVCCPNIHEILHVEELDIGTKLIWNAKTTTSYDQEVSCSQLAIK